MRGKAGAAILLLCLLVFRQSRAQTAPPSPDHAWHSGSEKQILEESGHLRDSRSSADSPYAIDPQRFYSLAELVDLAETHNPETRFAWERARAQAAVLGVARSELYPALAAVALSQIDRSQVYLGDRFFRQTVQDFNVQLQLNYTIFDFGARSGRINAARAETLAANFAFNDTHRQVIYRVEQTYYRLLNSVGQEDAARASLANAQNVQEAAEQRLENGLATLPDVLEARSATAQADYDLQAVLGAEEIARGDLATALGLSATVFIHVQPLDQILTPDTLDDSVDQAIDRSLKQRPDLMEQVAEIRSANARIKEARAAYYPALRMSVNPLAESLYGLQQQFPWGHTADLGGSLVFNLQWTIFDGGLRKNRLAQTRAEANAAKAQANVTRDRIEDEVWAAYSDLHTAFRQRQAATALLEAASQSYAAALESYNYGLRNLLDVTAAQRTLAQARSADVLARTQVLTSLAALAFRTGDSIQGPSTKARP